MLQVMALEWCWSKIASQLLNYCNKALSRYTLSKSVYEKEIMAIALSF